MKLDEMKIGMTVNHTLHGEWRVVAVDPLVLATKPGKTKQYVINEHNARACTLVSNPPKIPPTIKFAFRR